MLKNVVVLLMSKLETLNLFKNITLQGSRLGLPIKELSVVKSKLLYQRVTSPAVLPVLKHLPYPKSMFPSNYLLFSFFSCVVLQ